ncbi:MAG: ribosomal protein S18-alanine N-acetyltransferase [Clostridia bacterium]|nr:ribosomal protein S18-alanine N-acetyltransferase [Clostridia bacterium]
MNFEIVKMRAEHIPEIARLEAECFSQPWSENALSEELKNENSHFLAAVSDRVLGYIGVQEICGEAYITNVAVFGEYRKEGIGRKLLNEACSGAKERGCEFITLEVRESNSAAIALYESEGFEKAGVRKNFYSSPTENGIIYTKNFIK